MPKLLPFSNKIGPDDFDFLLGNQLLQVTPDDAKARLLHCLTPLTVKSGEKFIRQGDDPDCLFLIQTGFCSVVVERDDLSYRVAGRESGELVGELSILTGEQRTAHVQAETDMKLWRMDRKDFDELCILYPTIREFVTRVVLKRISDISKPIDQVELRIRLESLLKTKAVQDELKRYQAQLESTIEKRTEALRESEGRFRTIFEAAQDCIFLKDRNLKYSQVNPAMVSMLEVPLSQIIGKTDLTIFGPDYSRVVSELESRVLQGQTMETEHALTFKGRSILLSIIRFPMKDPQNQIIGVCGIARDITERKLRFADTSFEKPRYPSAVMQRTLLQAELVAGSNSITLLLGESGSGKDFLARYLHEHSKRSSGPFFAINCAALSPELVESELFGHEQGAFTGSHGRKRGLLELAEGGTLLLNEVGELHPRVQSKLLTFLDTESFLRVGGEKVVKVNARIIAATNRELANSVRNGEFREDLYHRLNVFSIYVPPLRERMEDLPLLTSELLLGICAKMGISKAPMVDPAARDLIMAYEWPGNVRELRNVLERAIILSDKQCIGPRDLNIPNCRQSRSAPNSDGLSFTLRITKDESIYDALTEAKRFFVTEGLKKSGGSIKNAARILGITRDSLVHLMRSLKIRR